MGRTDVPDRDLDRATAAVRDGDLVVYPTETVYGLGGHALSPAAVERIFEAKRRDRSEPVSLAVPSVASARAVTRPTDLEVAFMREFLPGPVTVVVERGPDVPDGLTAGGDRVGVRVPDHEVALALLERVAPLTATSANVSGRPAARVVADLDAAVRDAVAVVLDGGETPGGGSTVVDISAGEIYRHGRDADAVESWLEQRA